MGGFLNPGFSGIPGRVRFALGVAAALTPMVGAGFTIFSGVPERLISLYPFLLLPLLCSRGSGGRLRTAALFLLPGTLFAFAGIFLHRMSLVWAGSFWNLLAVLQMSGWRVSPTAALLILCVPPVSELPAVVLGFELRLFLTQTAGAILSLLDPAATAEGSRIFFQGFWVTVDRACEGLKMAGTSVLLFLSLGAHSAWRGRALAAIILPVLWLTANLSRILALIFFHIPAGSVQHEIIGLVFFLCIIVFPAGIIALLFPGKNGPLPSIFGIAFPLPRWIFLPLVFLIVLFFAAPPPQSTPDTWPARIGKFALDPRSTMSDPRIAVYHSENTALILKRDLFALGSAHDPRVCFEAAGFSVTETENAVVGRVSARRAVLEKGSKQILYWWFAWPGGRSVSDWDWRVRRIAGDEVTQWNLSGPDEAELSRSAAELILGAW